MSRELSAAWLNSQICTVYGNASQWRNQCPTTPDIWPTQAMLCNVMQVCSKSKLKPVLGLEKSRETLSIAANQGHREQASVSSLHSSASSALSVGLVSIIRSTK
jgi:hypothetical protein